MVKKKKIDVVKWTKVLIGSDQGKLRKVLNSFTWLFDIYIMQIQNVMCRQYCIFLILLENLIPWFPHFVWNRENIKLWTWNFILLSYSSQLRGKKRARFLSLWGLLLVILLNYLHFLRNLQYSVKAIWAVFLRVLFCYKNLLVW